MTSSTVQTIQKEQANRIKKLPPLLINQLAAGEVVTRPASVVKELIENAIDAGAKHITVRIMQGGMDSIEISDDGCGIHADDMMMAVTRFATSKIADVAQLQGIATLGFRGEALAATAAVSRLTLRSSSDDSGVGRELMVAGILDDTPNLLPIVHPKGTTVIVKDLYFNVPARRGNLKSISTEFAHIETVVKQLALVASDIDISLWHNDKRRFQFEAVDSHNHNDTSGANSSQSVLIQHILTRLQMISPSIFGLYNVSDSSNMTLLNLSLEGLVKNDSKSNNTTASKIGVFGCLLPYLGSSNNVHKLIYINGRLVKDKRIAQSMREGMNAVPALVDLGYVLFFRLPQTWLNVNVHPSKQSIKIQNLPNITAHLEQGVKSSLQGWYKKQGNLSESPMLLASTSKASLTAVSNTHQTIRGESYHQHKNIDKTVSQYDSDTDDIYTRSNQYLNQSLNHQVKEKQHTYQTNTANSESGLHNHSFNKDSFDNRYSNHDSHIEGNNKQLAKSTVSKCLVHILARLSLSEINEGANDSLLANNSLLTDSYDNVSPDTTLVLLQWQERIYVFTEERLLDVILSKQSVIVGEYTASIDSEKLGCLADHLEGVLNTISAKEQNEFMTQAIAKLSFAELVTLMLKPVKF